MLGRDGERRRFVSSLVNLIGGIGIALLSVLRVGPESSYRIAELSQHQADDASCRNARALRLRLSKSLARRRQRLSHAKVRSTTQRIGRTTKPLAWSERFTISTERCGRTSATAVANCGP